MIEQMTRLGMDVEYEVFCLLMLDVVDVAERVCVGRWSSRMYPING